MYNISPSTGNRGVGPRPVGLGVTIVTEEVSKKIGLARGGSWKGASGFGERETREREINQDNKGNRGCKYTALQIHCVSVWLSGRALRQQRKRLWVRFPGNTHTNEKMYNLNAIVSRFG